MVMPLTQTIKVMNDLIATCKDGEQCFRVAAESARSEQLRTLFTQLSRQRAVFAGELQGAVRRLDATPVDSGTMNAAVHRGWLSIKTLAIGKDDQAVIAECEREQDVAEQSYRAALAADLPVEVHLIAEAHHREMLNAQDRLHRLGVAAEVHAGHGTGLPPLGP